MTHRPTVRGTSESADTTPLSGLSSTVLRHQRHPLACDNTETVHCLAEIPEDSTFGRQNPRSEAVRDCPPYGRGGPSRTPAPLTRLGTPADTDTDRLLLAARVAQITDDAPGTLALLIGRPSMPVDGQS